MTISSAKVSLVSVSVLLLHFGSVDPCIGQQTTTKQICLSAFGMNWATSEEAQRHLATLAKRDAVSELFGEVIWSISEVKDLALTRDEVQSYSAGFVRLRGTPRFFNGTSLGELCIAAELYVLQEDVLRLQPRSVSKKVCVADPRLSSGELRELAERQAQIQAVQDFEPGLRGLPDELILKRLHEARIEEAGFISETLTYCARASGLVYPIELLTMPQRAGSPASKSVERVRPDTFVHVVFKARTASRARDIAKRLEGIGCEVSSAEVSDEYVPPMQSGREERSLSEENLLYHPWPREDTALEIQAALQDLTSLALLPSANERTNIFTLWVLR